MKNTSFLINAITEYDTRTKKILIPEVIQNLSTLWNWNFIPQGNDTKLDLFVEYTVPMPVLGKLAEKIVLKQNEREADLAIANIKAKMES